jgi:hypothetical protein
VVEPVLVPSDRAEHKRHLRSETVPFGSLSGSSWSDYYGHFGVGPYAAGFEAAISNVTAIGVSFGGGCFFENGVGTTDGSGTFTLNTFAAS